MAVQIPFRRDMSFAYGRADQLSPRIRRVIAKNPSPFTFHGTGTYLVGRGDVAVIDPGPADPVHIRNILSALGPEERISHVLITHTHLDHSPGAALLREHCDAKTYGYGPHGAGKVEEGVDVEEGGDMDFVPDVEVRHEDRIVSDGWTIECVYTPGHTSNHVCFALVEEKALFTGDHVMGWSTSVISPPDGDMGAYMRSLALLLARDDAVYWPTHGPSIREPHAHVRAFIAHRREREEQIVGCVAEGLEYIGEMVPRMYAELPEFMYPAAARSVFAAVVYLVQRGVLVCDGEPELRSRYALGNAD